MSANTVNSVFLSTDGRFALSGNLDRTVVWILDWELSDRVINGWDGETKTSQEVVNRLRCRAISF
ncbi:MAG: hypothetical protein KME64_34030 [Scytonematopsis contorta HA4267-MV1]|nr:hypothetical protein [Scytonematopsis contorta HA4267-MV1]